MTAKDTSRIEDWAREHGIELVPLDEPFDDGPDTPEDLRREVASLRAEVAELRIEVQALATGRTNRTPRTPRVPLTSAEHCTKTREALAARRAAGKVYGTIPLGFRRAGDLLVPEPHEQVSLEIAFRAHTEGASWRQVAAALDDTRPRPCGRPWCYRALARRYRQHTAGSFRKVGP